MPADRYIIVGEHGDTGEGPWDELERAEEYLAAEVGWAGVVLAVPGGKQPYEVFRDLVMEARLFVETFQPSPLKAFVYWPEEQAAVTADGEYIDWTGPGVHD